MIICSIDNSIVKKFDKELFFLLEKTLISSNLASDKDDFSVIKQRLISPPILMPDAFAEEVIYVILASGFRQKIAKQKFLQIMQFIHSGAEVSPQNILPIFANVNKVKAICKVWLNRNSYCERFYQLSDIHSKMTFLKSLPHIGDITKNHLARNLGINEVKYDIWIQRLGIALSDDASLSVGFPLNPIVKKLCDELFDYLEKQTLLPRGYIDVVLWKSCQIGLLVFN